MSHRRAMAWSAGSSSASYAGARVGPPCASTTEVSPWWTCGVVSGPTTNRGGTTPSQCASPRPRESPRPLCTYWPTAVWSTTTSRWPPTGRSSRPTANRPSPCATSSPIPQACTGSAASWTPAIACSTGSTWPRPSLRRHPPTSRARDTATTLSPTAGWSVRSSGASVAATSRPSSRANWRSRSPATGSTSGFPNQSAAARQT